MGHVAHFNFAYMIAPWGDPAVAGFTNNVDMVNNIAKRSEGFVARPSISERNLHRAIFARRGNFDMAREVATLSIWESPQALEHFVNHTLHGKFMARRSEWADPLDCRTYVIWPIKAGHSPDLDAAHQALERLERDGATAEAYDFEWLRARTKETTQ